MLRVGEGAKWFVGSAQTLLDETKTTLKSTTLVYFPGHTVVLNISLKLEL